MSNAEHSDENKFRIVDKRRFTSSGEPVAVSASGSESSPVPEPKKSEPTIGAGQSKAGHQTEKQDVEARSSQHTAQKKSAKPRESVSGGNMEIDFSSFVVSLATQAMMMLGEVPHPESGKRGVNMEAARQTIDILGLLEDKTQGNLTDAEAHLLSEALTSLRLAFVGITKASQTPRA